jgi:hypothetical protein
LAWPETQNWLINYLKRPLIHNNWQITYNRRSTAFNLQVCLHLFHIYGNTRRHALRCTIPLIRQYIIATLALSLTWHLTGYRARKAYCTTNFPTVYSHEQLNVMTYKV